MRAGWPLSRLKASPRRVTLASDLAAREKTIIEGALRDASGRVAGRNGAAARLGMPRQTLESKITKLGINRYRFLRSS